MRPFGRVPAIVIALVGSAGLVRCSSFGADGDLPVPDEASAPFDAASDGTFDAPVAPTDASHERTGVACGAKYCSVGESCCITGTGGITTCAADCKTVDGSFYIYECGRKSDCTDKQECCVSVNGSCGSGYAISSACVPTGNCKLCAPDGGGMGNGSLGCNPSSNDDCPANHTCTRPLMNTPFTGCSL